MAHYQCLESAAAQPVSCMDSVLEIPWPFSPFHVSPSEVDKTVYRFGVEAFRLGFEAWLFY